MPIGLQNVKYIFRVAPHDEDVLTHQLVGKVLEHGDNLDVLADYQGLLPFQSGPMDERAQRYWKALQRNPYFDVVSAQDLRDGKRPDLIREVEPPSAAAPDDGIPDPEAMTMSYQRPASKFVYSHPLLKEPMPIEVNQKVMYFNGQPLTPPEMARILELVRKGEAQIRYNRTGAQGQIQKAERMFEDLVKIEPHLSGALAALRAAVSGGHIDPSVLKILSREIFVDPMVEGIGNKKAYEDFLSRPRQGVHVRMDGNDFGQINKIHSFEHGNEAIKSMGQAMRQAMDEAVGSKNGKLFRIGGDEFHAHVPTHEHAAQFARTLREKLDAIPAIGGTHNLSVSMGIAPGVGQAGAQAADQASIKAKQAKKAANYTPGRAKTHAYSATPGNEGHIPLDPEQLPITKPAEPAEKKPETAPATAPAAKPAAVTPPASVPPVPIARTDLK